MHCRVLVLVPLISLLTGLNAGARPITFSSTTTIATGIAHPEHVAVADFNHDGNADLVISSTYNQIAVFLGEGDGTFIGPTIYNLTFYVTGSVAIGDFNGDGNADLAVVGGDTSGNGLAFLSGRGDGTFNSPIYFQTTLAGASLVAVAADFNHDHNLDLFVGGNGSSEVLLGNGHGDFQNGEFETGVTGNGVTVGDFNHDGNLDVATTQPYPSYNSNGVTVLLGNGDGTFQSPQEYSGIDEPFAIASGDFNHDNKLDLAITDYVMDTVVVLQGNGDGTFTNIGQSFANITPDAIAMSDFNVDGQTDLTFACYNDNSVVVVLGTGQGTFPTIYYIPTGLGPSDVKAVDLNHDGAVDLVTVNNVDNTFSVVLSAAGTYVNLTSSPDPSTLGQTVTFTATAHGSSITLPLPSGTVTFKDGSTILGSASLNNGTATFTTSALTKGTHNIMAGYSGDFYFNPNQSKIRIQKVQ
ncbi:MAG TPA: FG-GAP-like repeat-containing protein [Candidatus Sulfotelmatobacter sp.]|nr:FG-GAP-like repeat-containing protein [Candidatus Sulfotelmatobacter sp.]